VDLDSPSITSGRSSNCDHTHRRHTRPGSECWRSDRWFPSCRGLAGRRGRGRPLRRSAIRATGHVGPSPPAAKPRGAVTEQAPPLGRRQARISLRTSDRSGSAASRRPSSRVGCCVRGPSHCHRSRHAARTRRHAERVSSRRDSTRAASARRLASAPCSWSRAGELPGPVSPRTPRGSAPGRPQHTSSNQTRDRSAAMRRGVCIQTPNELAPARSRSTCAGVRTRCGGVSTATGRARAAARQGAARGVGQRRRRLLRGRPRGRSSWVPGARAPRGAARSVLPAAVRQAR
jgi:hypothetical protein